MDFQTIPIEDISLRERYHLMTGVVFPRPIAFVSSINAEGQPNLAPFSYFNMFSSQPPVAIFAPAVSGRSGENKDTYFNVVSQGEVVINLVSHEIVEQMVLTSGEFAPEVNEWEKSGLTPLASQLVKPARVAESPVQLECRVMKVDSLGTEGGAGNLVYCEVLRMHIKADAIDEQLKVDPRALDLVGRLGGAWYTRANGDALFQVMRPSTSCLGFDGLPKAIRESTALTGNEIAHIANQEMLPTMENATQVLVKAGEDVNRFVNNLPEAENYAKARIPEDRQDLALAALIVALGK